MSESAEIEVIPASQEEFFLSDLQESLLFLSANLAIKVKISGCMLVSCGCTIRNKAFTGFIPDIFLRPGK